MKTVLVTGSDGFLGRALMKQLARDGISAIGLNRASGDITDPAIFSQLPPISTVFHLAAKSYVPDSWDHSLNFMHANVIGTQNVINYCIANRSALIMASAYIYGHPQALPISEAHPVNPNNPYALSKRLAEQACEFAASHQGLNATVLRIFNVFGPGQRSDFLIPAVVAQVLAGQRIRVKDLQPKRDYVYIDDVIDAFLRAAQTCAGFNVFNIGSGKSISVSELIESVQLVFGTQLSVEAEGIARRQEISDVVADCRKAIDALGWRPRHTFEEGICHMMASGSLV